MTRWMLTRCALLGLLLAVATSAGAQEKGWVPLFNGKDLTGWKIHDKPSKTIVEVIKHEQGGKLIGYDGKLDNGKVIHLWRVAEGVLIGAGPPSHLFSERGDYVNFEYRIEAQINDKGNSGQYFRTNFAPGFPPGYEAQINATHGDTVKTGSLYPGGSLSKFKKEITVLNTAPHKPDEWFTQEVRVVGNQITIKVNGKQTIAWTDLGNTFKQGHFALQGHDPGTVVKFRKIEVRELPAEK